MREKVGIVGVFVLVAALWTAGYLWESGRIDLAGSPAATPSGRATPAPTATRDPVPAVVDPSAGPSVPGRGQDDPAKGLGKRAKQVQARADRLLQQALRAQQPPSLDFRVATINVLGHTHTAGNAPRYQRFASGTARIPGLLAVLAGQRIDVAGLQEFQPVQRAAFARQASGWSTYPGGGAFNVGTTSVTWRTDRFELVEGRLTAMPFYGGTRAAPSVLLRDRQSGVQVWVSTVHNPADTGKYPRGQGARNLATARQVTLVRELAASQVPVILTGDMNEKASYYCRFTSGSGFTAPGGSGGCRPPAGSGIDWIFGSPALQWTSYVVDRSALVRRTTDHAVRVAGVRVDAADFPGSWQTLETG